MTRSRSITGGSSSTASACPSTRSGTPTGTAGRPTAEAEREQLGIAWEDDLREDRAFKLGLDAIELTFKQLVPRLGEPVAVAAQTRIRARARRLGVERALLPRPRDPPSGCRRARADRGRLQGQDLAADPVQGRPRLPALRVPRRALARGRPGRRSSASRRSESQAPKRKGDERVDRDDEPVDLAAARRAGADRADGRARSSPATSASDPSGPGDSRIPAGWKCSPRYCEHWHSCPGGAGL